VHGYLVVIIIIIIRSWRNSGNVGEGASQPVQGSWGSSSSKKLKGTGAKGRTGLPTSFQSRSRN